MDIIGLLNNSTKCQIPPSTTFTTKLIQFERKTIYQVIHIKKITFGTVAGKYNIFTSI